MMIQLQLGTRVRSLIKVGDVFRVGICIAAGALQVGCPAWANPHRLEIFDLRTDNWWLGESVTLEEVILTSPVRETSKHAMFYIQDADGGANSGIQVVIPIEEWAILSTYDKPGLGDKLEITGEYRRFHGPTDPDEPVDLTYMFVATPERDLKITEFKAKMPPLLTIKPDVLRQANTAEQWRGVPVRVSNVKVYETEGDRGGYKVDDGMMVDHFFPELYRVPVPTEGTTLDWLSGIVVYTGQSYRLALRTCEDVVVEDQKAYSCVETRTIASLGQVPEGSEVTVGDVVVISPLTFSKKGFFIQDVSDGGNGPLGTIFVFTMENYNSTGRPDGFPDIVPGTLMRVKGILQPYGGPKMDGYTMDLELQSVNPYGLTPISDWGAQPVDPQPIFPDTDLSSYAGHVVTITNVAVTQGAAEAGDLWRVDGEIGVQPKMFVNWDGLESDPRIAPMQGQAFASITGILLKGKEQGYVICPRDLSEIRILGGNDLF